jgi:hypothetical protein
MKKKTFIGAVLLALLVLQAQTVFAQNYEREFRQELGRNNIRNIDRLLQRRANQMDLVSCMVSTISPSPDIYNELRGYNINNCLEVLRLLVRYGFDINSPWRSSSTYSIISYPLQLAVSEQRSFQIIQFLLDSGANPNLSSGTPPVQRAYHNGDMPVVNLLLDRGANGADLLSSAAYSGDNELIRRLISRGVQIRSDKGAEAIRAAARSGKLDTVKLLVENGVNVNARNNDGETALSIAYDKGEMEIYDYLKANGARDFEPRQVAQSAAPAPAPSSTTNVYVQPSAPAQSAPQSPAIPILQVGTYAASGTNHTMSLIRISDTSGTVNYYVGGGLAVGSGTYRISNNQLSLSFGPLSSNEGLKNKTFIYNITSSTSFSGNGETWARTGN